MTSLRREYLIKLVAFIGILSILILIMLKVEDMLVTQVLAFVIFYTINPLVNRLERAGFSRTWSIIIPFVACGFFIWFAFYLMSPAISQQITSLSAEYDTYINLLKRQMSYFDEKIRAMANGAVDINISEKVALWLTEKAKVFFAEIPNVATRSFTVMLLAPFFAYFMLKDGRRFTRQLLSLVPNNLFELSLNLIHQLNTQLGDFIRARFLESVIIGLIVWLGLEAKDIKYAFMLGMFAGITNLIPYIGPLIGAVPSFLVAFFTDNTSSFLFLYITLIHVIAQVIDMLVIIPLLVAKIVDLHPISVIVVIIIGSEMMGILGMIIAIPVASALKVISQAIFSHLVEFKS